MTDLRITETVEAQIADNQAKYGGNRQLVIGRLCHAKAECIADDVINGMAQWPPRLAEYRYLLELRAAEDAKAGV